jgi:tellurium resistance protein TerZ
MSVSLSKGQQVGLAKADGRSLTLVRMGLGWQAAPPRGFLYRLTALAAGPIDLDASAVVFSDGEAADVVFFEHPVSDDGSVRHFRDNLVFGAGAGVGVGGDEESILVDLQRVPPHIDQIVFIVTSFTGQTFAQVRDVFCRLLDENTGEELARYTVAGGGKYTAQVMAKVHRFGAGWQMAAIGELADGRTFQELMPAIASHL